MHDVAREVPINYVVRDGVDGIFVSNLARNKHIVVFGSSKQGKTCLRKYNLNDDEYIVVTCSNKWALPTVHSAILKAAGYTIEQSTTRTAEGTFKINVPLIAKGEAGVDAGAARTTSTSTRCTSGFCYLSLSHRSVICQGTLSVGAGSSWPG